MSAAPKGTTGSGLLAALAGKGDLIVLDQAAHGGLVRGARASGAELRHYPHRDYAALDELLAESVLAGRTVLVGIMGEYRLTGEVENVAKIAEIARAHRARTVLEDSGAAQRGLPPDAVDIQLGGWPGGGMLNSEFDHCG
ncbi:aminotransferase class V-fold PLP-dependent enzyme [Crossiella cryophila]|uniref:8-amino-7-oxononanoate synthase n=1 Tax=Crossiella cryophila TaxID=43355 RepID=A0A7W7FQK7_9PSEU|nr:aminotransferase class V-fold PLP-dependent enzyme [Crossiella cryophila]MBB4675066.1 7-keto-8-aminopelargonate synthetase-like enzyme [Crossiella cryophila]